MHSRSACIHHCTTAVRSVISLRNRVSSLRYNAVHEPSSGNGADNAAVGAWASLSVCRGTGTEGVRPLVEDTPAFAAHAIMVRSAAPAAAPAAAAMQERENV